MIDVVASLVSLCKLVAEGGKVYGEFKKRKLSDVEKELLVADTKDGKFLIVSPDGSPDLIIVGGRQFPADPKGDTAIAAECMDAFTNLCKRGYIEYDGGHLFRLTGLGFEKARKLAGK